MERIARVNPKVEAWLRVVPLEKWALSYDGGRRYRLMTTNLFEVFNNVLKGAQNVPITAYVWMTFYHIIDYFVLKCKAVAVRLSEGG